MLRGRYSDEYPDIVRLKVEIEKVKAIEAQRKKAAAAHGKAAPASAAGATKGLPLLHEPPEFERTRQQVAGLQAQIKASDKKLADRQAEQTRILKDLDTYQHRIEALPVREQEKSYVPIIFAAAN